MKSVRRLFEQELPFLPLSAVIQIISYNSQARTQGSDVGSLTPPISGKAPLAFAEIRKKTPLPPSLCTGLSGLYNLTVNFRYFQIYDVPFS